MTFRNCKKIIESGSCNKTAMTEILDVFLIRNRITIDEYNELLNLLG